MSLLSGARSRALVALSVLTTLVALMPALGGGPASASPSTVYVPETGHHLSEPFLSIWNQYDLAIIGYPISEVIEEDDREVQYFERGVMEHWPENAGGGWEVQLRLLGNQLAAEREHEAFAPIDQENAAEAATFFPETGHLLDGDFEQYWNDNGGLFVFGFPISEEFEEDGRRVQYFERARFEWWPEHEGTKYEVQLGHLGRDAAARKGINTESVERIEGTPDYNASPEPREVEVPILMYHDFGEPEKRYQMSLARFEEQLAWLANNGYESISLSGLYDAIYEGGVLPEKPVLLTFDDGFPSHWSAATVLERYGMRGTFFVTLHEPRLSNEQIVDLAARGHEIGSHTYEHLYSTSLSGDELWREIAGSRQELIEMGAGPVSFFAYPYGDYDQRTIDVVAAAGYRGAVAAWGGSYCTPAKRWEQPRIEVHGQMPLQEFEQLVLDHSSS